MKPGLTRTQEQGFVLVSVLWLVALVSLLVSALTTSAQTSARISIGEAQVAQLELAADAAVELVAARLASEEPDRWAANGKTYNISFHQVSLAITVQHATGLIDLNTTTPDELSAAFAGLLSSSTRADALLSYILTRRERARQAQDSLRTTRTNTGNEGDGASALAFRDVSELRSADVLDAQTYRRLKRYLTVFSGGNNIDRTYAPDALGRSLANLNSGGETSSPSLTTSNSRADPLERREEAASPDRDVIGEAFHISILATSPGIRRPISTSVVIMSDSGNRPYRSIAWTPFGSE